MKKRPVEDYEKEAWKDPQLNLFRPDEYEPQKAKPIQWRALIRGILLYITVITVIILLLINFTT